MAEPTTAITDFLLAGVAIGLALRLTGYWRLAFLFTAAGALIGGVYHASPSEVLWKLTVYCVGIANFFLICAGGEMWGRASARLIRMIAAIELAVYALWMINHDEFAYVIVDYGSGMLFIAALFAMSYRRMPRASRLVLTSVTITIIGAAVQAMRVSLHPQFNHNDLYHLIQIVALIFLYLGARASSINASTATASV